MTSGVATMELTDERNEKNVENLHIKKMKIECICRLLSLNDVDIVQCTQLNRIFKLSPSSSCTSFFHNDTCRTLKERTKKDVFCLCIGMRLHDAPLVLINAI